MTKRKLDQLPPAERLEALKAQRTALDQQIAAAELENAIEAKHAAEAESEAWRICSKQQQDTIDLLKAEIEELKSSPDTAERHNSRIADEK